MENIYFYLPTKIYFERGALKKYLPEIKKYGKKFLVVTGKHFVYKTNLLEEIKGILDKNRINYSIFSKVDSEPPIENAEEGREFSKKENCDAILAIGGGSAMDVGKAIAILSKNTGDLRDYFGEVEYENKPLPVIAIPTTCGTGSEVTRFSIIVDREEETKKALSSEEIIPKMAILDPTLLETLPPELIAGTGMDAISHSLEGFLSKKANPITKIISIESLKILFKFLPEAVNKRNIDDIEKVFLGSLLAGFVINHTGTIIIHGMGYSLTVKYGIHHGTANSLLMPYVLDFLKERGYREEIARIEELLKGEKLLNFIKKINLPTRLSEVGIKEKDLNQLQNLCIIGCKRAVKKMKIDIRNEDYLTILKKSF